MHTIAVGNWTVKDFGFGVKIIAPCGKDVWLQGDEANELIEELAHCETEEQEQLVLDTYSVLL